MNIKRLELIFIAIICNLFIHNIAYSQGYNSIFPNRNYLRYIQNWEVCLLDEGNNGNKSVIIQTSAISNIPGSVFSIGMSKIKNKLQISYFSTMTNPGASSPVIIKDGNGNMIIGGRSYNILISTVIDGDAIFNIFKFPNNFIELAKKNRYLDIKYNNISEKIDLYGFSEAFDYAIYLANNKMR